MRNWLHKLRKEKGLSQAELAELVGTKRPVVSQWESGVRRPGYDNMVRLADLLGPEVHARFAEEAANRHAQDGQVA
mgnify:CR=1 FL=1